VPPPTRRCPSCREPVRADAERCRRCGEDLLDEEEEPPRRGDAIRRDAPRRSSDVRRDAPPRRIRRDEDEDEDYPRRRIRRGPEYADCPFCGCPGEADKVSFTWWGGVVGPALFTHVKCRDCGRCYNGRTGNDNTLAITIYVLVGLAIGVGIGLAIALGGVL
jgi:hypothetical protein